MNMLRTSTVRLLAVATTLIILFTVAFMLRQWPVASASDLFAPAPTFPANPTPWPTVNLPPMTPFPTYVAEPTEEVGPESDVDLRPIDPNQPLTIIINPLRSPDTATSVNESTTILIGNVTEILPARWSTPDGQRPQDPRANGVSELIYTPVRIAIEQSISGDINGGEIIIHALGGVVGTDEVILSGDDLANFQVGDKVLVFVKDRGTIIDGNPRIEVAERYTITSDGVATNIYRSLPLADLLAEIQAATNQPLPTVVVTAAPTQ